MCKIVLTDDTTYELLHYLCSRKKEKIKRKQIKSENRRRDRRNDKY